MASLADFWRYGVVKTARKLKAAALSPVYAGRGEAAVRSAYGVLMVPNWQDTTFRYCIFGTYGRDLSDLLLRRRDDFVFVDIGANQGLYSLIAAQNPHCRQIIAFEPVPTTHARLAANVALNGGAARTALHLLAIADSVGEVTINVAADHTGTATLAGREGGKAASGGVTIHTIDAPVLDPLLAGELPMFVKIDVEGLEAVVIAELAKTANFARVEAIFYEVDDRWASAAEIEALLRGAGFTCFTKYGRGHHYDVLASRS
ncbi:FkbM family methyltransferase [Porphyrobacter sp. LM 6]|uniref:FkbM family methyltransferase n=1 Tax=Porphyrobacter sp. LM 6 TaxID=1896196 RepID=UPI0008639D37|nr:FkbM family methyltransferase [Porphyrobacter sp. LM 6]AOL95266.1 methyltransferase, FkbM family [Porphyrobacter sp. LM 6]